MLAISTDEPKAQQKFKDKLKAPFPFIADTDGDLVKLYGVKTPLLPFAQRYTFVIGEGLRVLKVDSGGEAIDPSGAIQACPLRKPPAK